MAGFKRKGALDVLGAVAHAAVLPAAGVSTPNTVATGKTAATMANRLVAAPFPVVPSSAPSAMITPNRLMPITVSAPPHCGPPLCGPALSAGGHLWPWLSPYGLAGRCDLGCWEQQTPYGVVLMAGAASAARRGVGSRSPSPPPSGAAGTRGTGAARGRSKVPSCSGAAAGRGHPGPGCDPAPARQLGMLLIAVSLG